MTSSVLYPAAHRDYFTSRLSGKDSPHTTKAYRRDLDSIAEIAANTLGVPLPELPAARLADLRTIRDAFAKYAEPRSKATVRRAWSAWSKFFDYLVAEGVIEGNPMAGVARPAIPRRLPRSFSREDGERIVQAVLEARVPRRDPWPELDRAIVLTVMVTGLRSSEVIGLNIGDVLDRDREPVLRVRGKGDADRRVPVLPVLIPFLDAYVTTRRERYPDTARQRGVADDASPFEHFRPRDPLFVGRAGERLSRGSLDYLVRLVYRTANVDGARERGSLVHALRHTTATRMAEEGATAVEIMHTLGHKSLVTSQRYIDATGRELQAAVSTNPVYNQIGRAPA